MRGLLAVLFALLICPAFAQVTPGTKPVNVQTANYTIKNTDCGKTIQAGTGSTGLFTVTLPSVSGFPATCSVIIKNGDSTRGKVLSGFPSDLLSNILWPNQVLSVGIVNGAWATLINPGKWSLAAAVNVFSDHANGSDTNNDCLGTGAGACATIQNALYTIKSNFNCGAWQATVQNANETFTENGVHVFGPSCDGEHPDAIIQGNPASPSSVVWQVSGNGNVGLGATDFGLAIVNGFKFVGLGTGDTALEAAQFGFVAFENIEFGTFTGGTHLLGFTGGIFVFEGGTYTVSGNASNHISLTTGATTNFGAIAISVPNALTFINWATLGQDASADFSGLSFTGTGAGAGSTGKRYSITLNASLFLNGISLPGASAGTATFGACTDAACASFPTTGLTGTLQAAQEPAHTGDMTNTAGSLATTVTKINGVDQTASWTTYTPTVTSSGGTITTVSATGRYRQIGKTVHLEIYVTITTAGTGIAQLKATLPINAAAFNYVGIAKESALTGKSGASQILGGTDATVVQAVDSAGVTFIASGGTVNYGITYEIP